MVDGVRHFTEWSFPSKVSGHLRAFGLYVLPNPPEFDTNKGTLVPILLGMDHLAGAESAMLIDFMTGLALNAYEEHPEAYQLKTNNKGHYIPDISYYLTMGNVGSGHASIHVHKGSNQQTAFALQPLLFHPLGYYDMVASSPFMFMTVSEDVHDRSKALLHRVHAAGVTHRQNLAQSSMPRVHFVDTSPNSYSHSLGVNGSQDFDPSRCGCDGQAGDRGDTEEGTAGSLRLLEGGVCRSSRPSLSDPSMAVLQSAPGGQTSEQPSWPMGGLPSVPSSSEVRAPGGQAWQHDPQRQSGNGSEDAQPAGTPDARLQADHRHLPGNVQED